MQKFRNFCKLIHNNVLKIPEKLTFKPRLCKNIQCKFSFKVPQIKKKERPKKPMVRFNMETETETFTEDEEVKIN